MSCNHKDNEKNAKHRRRFSQTAYWKLPHVESMCIKQNDQITPFEYEESYKDLGVTFDEKLTFRDHIQEKVHKAYAMLGIIKRNFEYISINNFIFLYKSMVTCRSLLGYCPGTGWPGLPYRKGDIEVLRKFRRRQPRLYLK